MTSTTALSTFDPHQLRTFSVGFDNIFDHFFDNASTTSNYPPYNIIKHDDEHFSIELAVAGFKKEDIEVETKENKLTIRSNYVKNVDEAENSSVYYHRGISKRQFSRTFTLSSDVYVKDASMVDGLLKVELERIIPDEKRPRIISIN